MQAMFLCTANRLTGLTGRQQFVGISPAQMSPSQNGMWRERCLSSDVSLTLSLWNSALCASVNTVDILAAVILLLSLSFGTAKRPGIVV